MNTKELMWFREVCDSKSMTKAAQKLYVSPQGLSKTIKNLEQEFAAELFVRTPNGVEMTKYGQLLYERSKILIDDYHKILADIALLKQHEQGYIKLCSAYGVLRLLSPDFIFDFGEKYPQLNLEYIEFPDTYIDEQIINEGCDVGFAIGPVESDELEKKLILSSDISLLVYEGHSIFEKEVADFRDIEGEALIIESHLFKIHSIIANKCRENGFMPNVIYNTSGFSLCHKLCSQKRGLSVVVDAISKDMSLNNMKIIPFSEECKWDVYMINKKEFSELKYIELFKKYALQEHVRR